MKKKFFIKRSQLLFVACLGVVATVFFIIMCLIGDDKFNIKLKILFGVIYISIITFGLLWRSGTFIFLEKEFILKRSVFHKKEHFKYEDMEKIVLLFYPIGGGRYGSGDPTVLIYLKKMKKAQVSLEIQYQLIQQLLEKKPAHSQIKIEFYFLRIFSEKYRELLKDYLTGAQKEEIARLLAKKEAKRKKRTNK